MFQGFFLYDTKALFVFNAGIWIPQIVKTYKTRSRKGPSLQLALVMTMTQSFLPFYLKLNSRNFLDMESSIPEGMALVIFVCL